jgi:capsid protein
MSESESLQDMRERRQLSTVDKAISFVSPKWALQRVVAREHLHEFAAVKHSKARGRPATLNDQGSSESWRKQRERIDAMMEGREMEENFCVIAGLLQKLGLHIAGQLEYQPETGDDKINAEYAEYFHDWCGRADYAGRHRFRTMVQLGVQSAIRDGQHGWVEKIVDGELRLQMIEGDRIGNPQNPSQADEKNINGIVIDDKGAIRHYEIYKRTRTTQYEKENDVTPDDFIHLFFPNRTDQYHGVSKLAPALPHARDLYELLGYEKIGAKFAAQFAGFVRTKDVGAPGSTDWNESTPGSGLPASMKAQAGTVLKLENGVEDIEFAPGVQRPSGAFMALLEALIREIALAMNLPYGFVYNLAALGGVTARLETQQAQRTFRWYQEILEHILLNRVKRKVLLFAIASGRLRACKNWNKGSWRYGQTLTGDIGFQVQADLDLVKGGYKTRSQLAADYNNDFAQVMDQKGSEIQIAMKVSKRTGVPIELLLSDLDNPTALIAALERAKSGDPDPAAGPPPPPGLIGTVGDKGVKSLLDMVMAVNRGEMDRDSGINTAMISYGMPFQDADALFPKNIVVPPVADAPNKPDRKKKP